MFHNSVTFCNSAAFKNSVAFQNSVAFNNLVTNDIFGSFGLYSANRRQIQVVQISIYWDKWFMTARHQPISVHTEPSAFLVGEGCRRYSYHSIVTGTGSIDWILFSNMDNKEELHRGFRGGFKGGLKRASNRASKGPSKLATNVTSKGVQLLAGKGKDQGAEPPGPIRR